MFAYLFFLFPGAEIVVVFQWVPSECLQTREKIWQKEEQEEFLPDPQPE